MMMQKIGCLLLALVSALGVFGQAGSAQVAFEASRFEEARRLFAQAAQVGEDPAMRIFCLTKVAQCHARLGQFGQATAQLRQLKTLDTLSPANRAALENVSGEIALQMGLYDQAIGAFEQAQQWLTDADVALRAECQTNLGLAHWQMGNQQLAVSYLMQALEARKSLGKPRFIAKALNNLGLIFSEQDPPLAMQHYAFALEIFQQEVGTSHPDYVLTLNNLAIVQSKSGNHKQALKTYQIVLSDWQNIYGEEHPNVAFTLNNLAKAFIAEKELAKALFFQRKAISIYQNVYGKKHPDLSAAYYQLAGIYQLQQQYDSALVTIQASILANTLDDEGKTLEDNPADTVRSFRALLLVSALQRKARIYQERHDQKSLRGSDLRIALRTLERCGEHIARLRQRLVKKSDRIALGHIAAQVYEEGILLALTLADYSLTNKQTYLQKAFAFGEKSKAAVLLASIADAKAKTFAGLPDSVLAEEQQIQGQIAALEQLIAEKPDNEQARGQLLRLEVRYQQFVAGLEEDFPQYYALKYAVEVASVEEIQAQIPADTQLRSYVIGAQTGRLFIFELTRDQLKVRNEPLPDDFDRMITGFRNAIIHQIKPIYLLNARKLYRVLFPNKPARHITRLQIIPDGRLSMVPFEALLSKRPKADMAYADLPYLVKDYACAYGFSATLLALSRPSVSDANEAVLIAPVDFGQYTSQRGAGLAPLYGSAIECQRIARLMHKRQIKVRLLTQSAATESAFKSAQVQRARYVHLATHGVVNEEEPRLSEIFLHQDAAEDGDVFTGEIYGMRFQADLLVISACQTGLGKVSRGEGIIGLSRAFVFAGVNNLTVSYWQVADFSTAQLMEQFYRAQASEDEGYAQALQAAKSHLISKEETAPPFFWAAFVLIGR